MAEHDIKVVVDLVDNMSADMKAMRANMEAQFRSVNDKVKESKGAFSKLGDEIKGSFVNAVRNGIVAYAGFEVIGKITNLVREGYKDFQESERTQLKLRTALGQTSQALNEQAEALSKKLRMDDDEISAAQAAIAIYTRNEEQIKGLTAAALDLAAATGQSLVSAANLLGRSLADDGAELGKLMVSVNGTTGSMERYESIVKGVNTRMGDQSVALAQTKTFWDQTGNAIGNVTKKFVGLFIATEDEKLKNLQKLISETRDRVEKISNDKFFKSHTALASAKSALEMYIAQEKEILDRRALIKNQADAATAEIEQKNRDEKIKADQEAADKAKKSLEERVAAVSAAGAEEIRLQNEKEQRILAEKEKIFNEEQANRDEEIRNRIKRETDIEKRQVAREKEAQKYRSNLMKELNADTFSGRMANLEASYNMEIKLHGKTEADKYFITKKYEKMAFAERQQFAVGGLEMAGQLFSAIADSNQRSAEEKRNIARVEAGINTAVAITKALPNPFMVAFATAIGIAQQVAISNAQFASGTGYAGGGTALVGEYGPEMVSLPRGARVMNAQQTRNEISNNTSNVTVNVLGSNGRVVESLRASLRSGNADSLVRDLKMALA
jgi:hypothetical protein